MNEAKNTMNS